MKIKYLFALILSTLLFSGCASDDDPMGSLSNISVSQSYLAIPEAGGTVKLVVNAAEDWKIVSANGLTVEDTISVETGEKLQQTVDKKGKKTLLWCKLSTIEGAAGETEVTITAPADEAPHTTEFHIACGDYGMQVVNVKQGVSIPETATCANVIAGADGKTYRVKGTVTAIANTTYGNWYLNDGTGEIYIYGTYDANGAEKNFASLNIEVGDVVEVEGPKETYGTTVELKNVTVNSITKSLIKIITESKELQQGGEELDIKVAYKGKGAYFEIPSEYADWIQYKSSKFIAGVPSKLEKNPADTCLFTFTVMPNVGADRSGSIKFTSSTSNNTSEVTYNFTQKGSIVLLTCADFNAAPVGPAQYRLIGLVTKVANEKYGNIYVQDYTGSVYVYGTTNYADYPVKAGDVVNIVGPRAEHKGSPQMKDGTIDELCASAEPISLADFNAAADGNDKYYLLTGKITEIANDKYGNVYIEDGTGAKVYLYGVYGDWTGANKQYFIKDNGIAVGDEITVVTIKTSYNGAAQGKNAVCFGVKKAE